MVEIIYHLCRECGRRIQDTSDILEAFCSHECREQHEYEKRKLIEWSEKNSWSQGI